MSTDPTWNRIRGSWKQLAGKVHGEWGKLTHGDIAQIDGQREQLVGPVISEQLKALPLLGSSQ